MRFAVAMIASHAGLRGLAASAVATGHFTEIFAPGWFLPHTHIAVDFFFLLSGFILTHVYAADFAAGLGLRNCGCFLLRRLARIYPLHLATLVAILAILRFHLTPEEAGQLGPQLVLAHAWGLSERYVLNAPSWSISVEFGAYLAFPLLVLLLGRRGGWLVLAGLSLAGVALLWPLGAGSLDLHVTGSRHVWLRGLVAFPLGMLLAALAARHRAGAAAGWLQGGALAGFVALIALSTPEMCWLVPMAVMVWACAGDRGWIARIMASRPMVWLGEVSYGIYLIQWVVILALYNIVPKLGFLPPAALTLATGLLYFGGVLGLAALSARWYEPTFTRLAHRCRLGRG